MIASTDFNVKSYFFLDFFSSELVKLDVEEDTWIYDLLPFSERGDIETSSPKAFKNSIEE